MLFLNVLLRCRSSLVLCLLLQLTCRQLDGLLSVVDSPTSRSFRLRDRSRFAYTVWFDSPTLTSFRLHLSRKYFAKIDEYYCSQVAEHSRIWPYFQLNSEILYRLTEEGSDFWFEFDGRFEESGFRTVSSRRVVGEREVVKKIMQLQLYGKQTNILSYSVQFLVYMWRHSFQK